MATTNRTQGRRPLDLPRALHKATKDGKLKWVMVPFEDVPTVTATLSTSVVEVREDGYFAFKNLEGTVIYDIAPHPPTQPVLDLFEAARANAMNAGEVIDRAMKYLNSLG